MTLEELLTRVERTRLRAHTEWFRRWHRPAIAITTTTEEIRLGASRFGGVPDLPVDVEWPRHDKGPYRFLAQIDLADLPSRRASFAEPWRDVLPSDGVLSLFVADDPTREMDPRGEIFWGDPRYAVALLSAAHVESSPRQPPPEVDFGAPAAIAFTPTIDIPRDEYQVRDWPFTTDEHETYDVLRATLHGRDYLFGYPQHCTLAYDPTPTGQIPLLSLGSDDERAWYWHDGDCLMLFLEPGRAHPGAISLGSDAG
ncbi:DUF1963 domain-containing protein [Sandaracinus amylolyticus]|nr:DUF1963 domain-containing protein [Sandaracinus amylolyticus]